jgi:hypothetical protein
MITTVSVRCVEVSEWRMSSSFRKYSLATELAVGGGLTGSSVMAWARPFLGLGEEDE